MELWWQGIAPLYTAQVSSIAPTSSSKRRDANDRRSAHSQLWFAAALVSVKLRISFVRPSAKHLDKNAMRVSLKLIPLSGPLPLACNFQPAPGVRELRYRI